MRLQFWGIYSVDKYEISMINSPQNRPKQSSWQNAITRCHIFIKYIAGKSCKVHCTKHSDMSSWVCPIWAILFVASHLLQTHLICVSGSQIIDLMILVVDIVKGMQTQTAECLVIGEILCDKMIVVLNKVDLVPQDKRTAHIEKVGR